MSIESTFASPGAGGYTCAQHESDPGAVGAARGLASIGGADVTTVPDYADFSTERDALKAELLEHVGACDIGHARCADCRAFRDIEVISSIVVARCEVSLIGDWLRENRDEQCVYCDAAAEHADHLVPMPWTGPATRKFVPTVPSCGDCNVRINASLDFTISGRCEIVATSLRKKHKKQLAIPPRPEGFYDDMSYRMATTQRAKEAFRDELRRRLIVLDAGGAPQALRDTAEHTDDSETRAA